MTLGYTVRRTFYAVLLTFSYCTGEPSPTIRYEGCDYAGRCNVKAPGGEYVCQDTTPGRDYAYYIGTHRPINYR